MANGDCVSRCGEVTVSGWRGGRKRFSGFFASAVTRIFRWASLDWSATGDFVVPLNFRPGAAVSDLDEMTSIGKIEQVEQEQRRYARLAGLLLLGAIIVALGGGAILSNISGNGTFAETASRIAASERLYRVALSSLLIVTLSSILLAFALYATLKPVNSFLAQLGMIFSLGDSFLALIVRMCSFVRLHLYISTQGAGSVTGEMLSDVLRTIGGTTENIGGVAFGIGSCLFYYLFFTSRYIPRTISVLGFVASMIWTCLYFGGLMFPERHSLFQYICLPPMALAEIVTGFYLMLFAIGTDRRLKLTAPGSPAMDA